MFKSDLFQSGISFLVKIGSGFAAYVLFAVISRNISPAEFGEFSILFSLSILIGTGGSVGLQMFIIREIPRQRVAQDKKRERAVYRFARNVLFASIPITATIYLITSNILIDTKNWGAMIAGSFVAILFATSQATFGILRVHNFTIFAVLTRDLLWRIIALLFVLALAHKISGPQIGVYALAFALMPIVILHIAIIVRTTNGISKVALIKPAEKWLSSALGMGLVGIISSADFYIYTILLGLLLSTQEAGVFFASLKTAELLNMFLMAVTLVISPKLSHYVASNNQEKLQQYSNLGILIQTVPLLLSIALLLPLSKTILHLFDPSFAKYWPLLWSLALIMLFNALTGATVLLMQIGGMHWLQVFLQGGSLLLSIGLLPLFTYNLGVYGAVASFAISKLLWNIFAIHLIRKKLKIDPSIVGLFNKKGGGLAGAINLALSQLKPEKK